MTSRSSTDKRKSRAAARAPIRPPAGSRDEVTVRQRIEHARLDLLRRINGTRLLDTPRGWGARTVEIVGESSDDTWRRLVTDEARLGLMPRREADTGEALSEPADTVRLFLPAEPALGVPNVPSDEECVRTGMPSADLQSRLLQIEHDAWSFEREQSTHSLYLALGSLSWSEDGDTGLNRVAPLVLLPVELRRANASSAFRISFSGHEARSNLALEIMLRREFDIELPQLPTAPGVVPSVYADAVQEVIAEQGAWTVQTDDIVLGVYSFAAFEMIRDLDPSNWSGVASLDDHPVLRTLLCHGPAIRPSKGPAERAERAQKRPVHIVASDKAQDAAMAAVIEGQDLVIQGPPGAGKSQTITNLIAWAIRERKRVLFVAQKRSALEAVKARLDQAGLEAVSLDLSGESARPDAVLDDLGRTLGLPAPEVYYEDQTVHEIRDHRLALDDHVRALHEPIGNSGIDAYIVAGHLVELAGRGAPEPAFELEDATTWSREEYASRLQSLARLAGQIARTGVPADHPWRGVGSIEATETEAQDFAGRAGNLDTRIAALWPRLHEVASRLGLEASALGSVDHLAAITTVLVEVPELDVEAIVNPVWEEQREKIDKLVEQGKRLETARRTAGRKLADDFWRYDLAGMKEVLSSRASAALRLLSSNYRIALADYRRITGSDLPGGRSARLRKLNALVEAQSANQAVQNGDAVGRAAFGADWGGPASDWERLGTIVDWEARVREAGAQKDFRVLVGDPDGRMALANLREEIGDEGTAVQRDLRLLCEELQLDVAKAFGSRLDLVPIRTVRRRLQGWAKIPEGLLEWVQFRREADGLEAQGLGDLIESLSAGKLRAPVAVDAFRRAYFEALLASTVNAHPELAAFSGPLHERRIEEFQALLERTMLIARAEVAAIHHRRIPTGFGGGGEVGVLWRELRKRSRQLSLRRLFVAAGRTIQDLKPVFMMSPANVARYLEPGILNFDLLLVDEASQVRPAEALGSIARTKQIVVFGDSEQLPPSRDFDRLAGDEEVLNGEADRDVDGLGSLLELCISQGLPQKQLDGHYRSRHPSLIAVPNHEFYDDRLRVPPASGLKRGVGVSIERIADVVFDDPAITANRDEARRVAEAVMEHARSRPDVSLAVGTLTVAQRDAVLDAVERLRRDRPDQESFFDSRKPEPFFVESVAALQGDVRDTMFVSIGFAKDPDGFVPLGGDLLVGDRGARRLNVLFTRARHACRVFSSISATDIDLGRSASRGAALLRTFLHHAERGGFRIPRIGGRDPASPLEDEVAWSLRRAGYAVEHRVGSSSAVVDLAVLDPVRPGVSLLGVLFDGDVYAAVRSAEDRDVTRPRSLEARGWRLHRVWSLDWARDRSGELDRLLSAVDAARVASEA